MPGLRIFELDSLCSPCLRCSLTIQLSNAENSRDVEMPPSTRPSSKSRMSGMCSRAFITTFFVILFGGERRRNDGDGDGIAGHGSG